MLPTHKLQPNSCPRQEIQLATFANATASICASLKLAYLFFETKNFLLVWEGAHCAHCHPQTAPEADGHEFGFKPLPHMQMFGNQCGTWSDSSETRMGVVEHHSLCQDSFCFFSPGFFFPGPPKSQAPPVPFNWHCRETSISNLNRENLK